MRKTVRQKKTRGRPATGRDPSITIRLPADLIETLKLQASIYETTVSEIVRRRLEAPDELPPDHKSNGKTRVAYHEAGHAVIGAVLGKDIMKATIKATRKARGRVHYISRRFSVQADTPARKRPIQHYWHADVISLMAGRAAEVVNGFGDDPAGASSDERHINKMLRFCNNPERIEDTRRRLHSMTIRLVLRHQATIQRVARRLIAKETIQGDEIEEIVRLAQRRARADLKVAA